MSTLVILIILVLNHDHPFREFAKKRWSEDREFGARATFRDTVQTISILILTSYMTMMVEDKHYDDQAGPGEPGTAAR